MIKISVREYMSLGMNPDEAFVDVATGDINKEVWKREMSKLGFVNGSKKVCFYDGIVKSTWSDGAMVRVSNVVDAIIRYKPEGLRVMFRYEYEYSREGTNIDVYNLSYYDDFDFDYVRHVMETLKYDYDPDNIRCVKKIYPELLLVGPEIIEILEDNLAAIR